MIAFEEGGSQDGSPRRPRYAPRGGQVSHRESPDGAPTHLRRSGKVAASAARFVLTPSGEPLQSGGGSRDCQQPPRCGEVGWPIEGAALPKEGLNHGITKPNFCCGIMTPPIIRSIMTPQILRGITPPQINFGIKTPSLLIESGGQNYESVRM